MQLYEGHVCISLKNGHEIKFMIIHNIPLQNGPVNSFEAAVDSWAARTDEYTALSLIHYINSKSEHVACTQEQFIKFYSDD